MQRTLLVHSPNQARDDLQLFRTVLAGAACLQIAGQSRTIGANGEPLIARRIPTSQQHLPKGHAKPLGLLLRFINQKG
jgi:hypothetical protein